MPGLAGHWWIILIGLVVVLIIWGPGKLPDVGAGLGRAIREFRHATTEARDAVVNSTATPPPSQPAPTPTIVPLEQPAPTPAPVPDDHRTA